MAATRTFTMQVRFAHNPSCSWAELADALGHKLHIPKRFQRPLCDAVDRRYGWTPGADR